MFGYRIMGGVVLAAGMMGGVVLLAGKGLGESTITEPAKEADLVDVGFENLMGDVIHVVGVSKPADAIVEPTVIGKAVLTNDLPETALCQAVIEAIEKDGQPDIPKDMQACMGKAMTPVRVEGSLSRGAYLWLIAVRGACCERVMYWSGPAQDLVVGAGYWGSSMDEFIKRPAEDQARLLRTSGICVDAKGKTYSCTVPVGDPRAVFGADVWFPLELAGRGDMKFLPVKDGKVEPRIKTAIVAPIEEP